MKYVFIILLTLTLASNAAAVPTDTTQLKTLYDRVIDFSEEKLDSIQWYAEFIERESAASGFKKGKILAQRLYGLHNDLTGNYDEALKYFLNTLTAAREANYTEYEISALSDLSILYSEIKQPEKAKEVYLECLKITEKQGEISAIISGYSNIAAIYNMLNNTDSALYFLTMAHSLSIEHNHTETLPFIYNNTGNVYFKRKEYSRALDYFRLNKKLHDKTNSLADLWVDHLNMGDAFLELKHFDSASWYCQSALDIAIKLESKSKEADANALMAKLQERLGSYKKAYAFQKRWHELDSALVNETSSRTIAEMQERFHARDREKQNQLLLAQVEKEKLRNRYLSYQTIAAIIIGLLISGFLVTYRRSNQRLKEVNQVIGRQKEKLASLNQEKNSLISIVSHDLSSPFASIAMWVNHIGDESNFTPEQQKAIQRIRDSARHGERLIRNILDIEKAGTSLNEIDLEETDLIPFITNFVAGYQNLADAKSIQLHPPKGEGIFLLTDHHLLGRIMDNLLSNALKFSPAGKNVWVEVSSRENKIEIAVADEGPGIPESEKNLLFTKYAQLSARPTGGEQSTGLGLSIVKRLVNELNGQISVDTEPGKGSRFVLRFEK